MGVGLYCGDHIAGRDTTRRSHGTRDHDELAETVLFASEYHILVGMCRGVSPDARKARRGHTMR